EAHVDLGFHLYGTRKNVGLHGGAEITGDHEGGRAALVDHHLHAAAVEGALLTIIPIVEDPPVDGEIAGGINVIDVGHRFFHTSLAKGNAIVPGLRPVCKFVLALDHRQVRNHDCADEHAEDQGDHENAAGPAKAPCPA